MEYKMIYRPYVVDKLVKSAETIEGYAANETREWNSVINKEASQGWRVIQAGSIDSDDLVLLWAMLERGT